MPLLLQGKPVSGQSLAVVAPVSAGSAVVPLGGTLILPEPASVTPLPPTPASPAFSAPPGRQRRRLLWTAGICTLIAAIVVSFIWERHISDVYLAPRDWRVVESGSIYRSGQVSRHLIRDVIAEHKLRAIIFMSEDKTDRPDVQAEAAAAAEMGVRRYNFPLAGDGTGNPMRYADAIEVMARCHREGSPVLVHCHTGSQRTGGAVALYRLLIQQRPPADVHRELLAAGHDPEENPKLIPYLNQHMDDIAAELVRRGVIAEVPRPLPVLGK